MIVAVVSLTNIKLPAFLLTPRRKSIKSVAMPSIAKPVSVQGVADAKLAPWQIESKSFGAFFDLDSGAFCICRKNKESFVLRATSCAVTPQGKRSIADADYARCVKVLPIDRDSGAVRKLMVQCIDRRHQLDFELHVSIYEDREELVIETICRNVSKENIPVQKIEPIQGFEKNAVPLWINPSPARKQELILLPGASASSKYAISGSALNPQAAAA